MILRVSVTDICSAVHFQHVSDPHVTSCCMFNTMLVKTCNMRAISKVMPLSKHVLHFKVAPHIYKITGQQLIFPCVASLMILEQCSCLLVCMCTNLNMHSTSSAEERFRIFSQCAWELWPNWNTSGKRHRDLLCTQQELKIRTHTHIHTKQGLLGPSAFCGIIFFAGCNISVTELKKYRWTVSVGEKKTKEQGGVSVARINPGSGGTDSLSLSISENYIGPFSVPSCQITKKTPKVFIHELFSEQPLGIVTFKYSSDVKRFIPFKQNEWKGFPKS